MKHTKDYYPISNVMYYLTDKRKVSIKEIEALAPMFGKDGKVGKGGECFDQLHPPCPSVDDMDKALVILTKYALKVSREQGVTFNPDFCYLSGKFLTMGPITKKAMINMSIFLIKTRNVFGPRTTRLIRSTYNMLTNEVDQIQPRTVNRLMCELTLAAVMDIGNAKYDPDFNYGEGKPFSEDTNLDMTNSYLLALRKFITASQGI